MKLSHMDNYKDKADRVMQLFTKELSKADREWIATHQDQMRAFLTDVKGEAPTLYKQIKSEVFELLGVARPD